MTTDVRDGTVSADEVLSDVRDLDEVREPDKDARARAVKLRLPDLRGTGTSIPTRLILGGRV